MGHKERYVGSLFRVDEPVSDDSDGLKHQATTIIQQRKSLKVRLINYIYHLDHKHIIEYISDVINKAATLPPNTPLEKYRMLLPDKWKENR